jgi:uncharacterized small protein (TIGR04563 family)
MTNPLPERRKQSLYFPEAMLAEIQREAERLDRSLSWVVQQAWRLARREMKRFPSVNGVATGTDDRSAAPGGRSEPSPAPRT